MNRDKQSTPEGKFSYEWISGTLKGRADGGGHFRIRDAQDNALAFCYSEHNAVWLTDMLNAAVSETERIAEAERLLGEWLKRADKHPEINEFKGGYQPCLGRATREFLNGK